MGAKDVAKKNTGKAQRVSINSKVTPETAKKIRAFKKIYGYEIADISQMAFDEYFEGWEIPEGFEDTATDGSDDLEDDLS